MLFIRGKCTIDKIDLLFDVFKMVLMEINFDDSQSILLNALKSSVSSKKSDVASRGHSYANTRIRGRYSVRCKWKSDCYFCSLYVSKIWTVHTSSVLAFIDEKMYGVSSLESYATVLEAVESDWENFVVRLKNLREVSIILFVTSTHFCWAALSQAPQNLSW